MEDNRRGGSVLIIDRLFKEVEDKGIVCVGLDTSLDYIHEEIKVRYQDIDDIIFEFNKIIIDCTQDLVAIYKLQIAFYEANGVRGIMAYKGPWSI